jgi:hypothetical protein
MLSRTELRINYFRAMASVPGNVILSPNTPKVKSRAMMSANFIKPQSSFT